MLIKNTREDIRNGGQSGQLTRSLVTAAGGLAGIIAAFGRPPDGGGGGGGPEPLKPGMGGGGGGGGGPGIALLSFD